MFFSSHLKCRGSMITLQYTANHKLVQLEVVAL